jgi:hypothetical protein
LQELLLVRWEAVDACRQHGLDRGRDLDAGQGLHETIRARGAGEGARFHEGADALFEEERVALRPLDQQPLERLERGIDPEQDAEHLVGALRRERVDPELAVIGLAPPAVLVLGTVVHEQQEPGGWHAFHEVVEEGLRLGIDPMQVLEHEEQGLDLALAQHQALEPVEGLLPPLRRIECQERAALGKGFQKRQHRRDHVPQALVQREQRARHFRANGSSVVAAVHLEVGLEEIDDGQISRRLAVRHRPAVEDQPFVEAIRVGELVEQARLPDPRLSDDGHHLALAATRPLEGAAQEIELGVAPHEAGEAARGGGLQPGAHRAHPRHFPGLERLAEPLRVDRAQRCDLHKARAARPSRRHGGDRLRAARGPASGARPGWSSRRPAAS